MNADTKYHNKLEINEEEILTFDKGIPGFPGERNFIVLPLSEDNVFYVLQSMNNPGLAFIISNPFNFFQDYDFTVDDQSLEELELYNEEDVLIYSILTVEDPFRKTTANLQAPIVINTKKKRAKQIILNSDYKTKHPIFQGKE